MNNLRFLILLFPLLILGKNGTATHLMGGDLTYRHLQDSTYELTFLVYRDCNSGQATIDPRITYWVYYKKSKNIFLNNRTVELYKNQTNKVLPEAPNCVTPSGVCIESGRYIDTVQLGSDPDGYIVNWFRLARNYDITNLRQCVSSSNNNSCITGSCNNRYPFGMVWTAEIPPHKFKNSSPQFLTVPVPYFCTGITNSFNHVVFDPDGDSLVFKLETPLSPDNCAPVLPRPSSTVAAPSYSTTYEEVEYQTGYSVTRPFGSSSSAISINSTTGEMKANPSSAGNYVIAVKIEEYRVDPVTRKATYLGSIRRDLQFIAGNCPNVTNSPPYFTQSGNSTIEVNPFDTVKFTIKVADQSDTVYMKANGSIFGGAASTLNPPFASFRDTQGFKAAEQEFFWVPTCDHITYTSPHIFTINLSDEGCNTVQRTYSVYVRGRKIYTPPDVTCIKRLSKNVIQVNWDTLKNVQFFNGLHVYRVDPDGSRKKIRSFSDSTVVGFNDSTVNDAYAANVRYYLRIENSCGLEGFRSDSLSTIGLSYTEINDNALRFTWTKYGDGPYKYILEKKINNAFEAVDSTINTTANYASCVLNTDFRIKVVDTINYASCIHYSDTVTSSTVDTSPPTGAPTLRNANVLNYKNVELTFNKSTSAEVNQYGIIRSVNGGNYSIVGTTSSNSNTITYNDANSLSTSNRNYCYSIVAQDSCGNSGDTSLQHCIVNMKGYDGQRESKLKWNKYKGYNIDSQFVQRYDTINNVWVNIAALGADDSTYIDNNNTFCGLTYFYRLVTKEKTTGTPYYSTSDSVFTLPKDTIAPPAIDVISATNVDDTTSAVTFKKAATDDVKDYLVIALEYDGGVLQNTDINNFSLTGQDTFTVNVKTSKTDTRNYCFGVLAVDSCGQNFSSNNEIHCLSFLTGQAQNLSNRLDWTNYTGFLVDSFIVETKENGVWETRSAFNRTRRNITYNNLGCNIPVEYRLKVKERNTGLSIYTNDIRLTPFDTIKPKSPVVNFTTVDNDTTIRLEWDKSTSGDVYKYEVLAKVNSGSFSLLDSFVNNSSNTFTYRNSPIAAKTDTFSYRIVAVDSCDATNRSVNNKLQTALQLSGEGANQENNLRWNAYSGFDVKEYEIETLDPVNNSWSTLQTLTATDSSYVHENLYCFDTITYRIKAVDNNSTEISYSDTIRLKPFDTISPIPPVIKYASVIAQNRIVIAWNRSQSDDANKYVLFRKSANTSYAVVDTILNKLSYTDQVSTDSVWTYSLIAIDSCTENSSFYKSDGESTMLLSDAKVGCEGKQILNWTAYTDFENGLSGYEVYRSINGKPEVRIAQLNTSTTTYTDNVNQHLSYVYRIKAIENGGANESFSQSLESDIYRTPVPRVYTVSVLESNNSNGEIEINWEKQQGVGQVEYSQLYYKPFTSANFSLLQNNIPLTDSSFTHTSLNTKTQTHQYFLVNIDSCSSVSDTMSIHRSMDMVFGYGQLVHNLSWNAYQGYTVERYILQQLIGANYVNIDTVDASSSAFRRFPAPCNTPIIYRIAAEDDDGNQSLSDTTMGTAIDLTVPDAPEIRNIMVQNGDNIRLDFRGVDSLDTYGFAIEKSRNGGPYLTSTIILFTGQKQLSTFLDTVKLDSIRYSYRVVALDSCLNANTSNIFKPIALKGISGNFETHLAWHPFVGYPVDSYIVEYQVAPFDVNNNWIIAGSTQPSDTSFTHQNVGCNQALVYRVRAEQATGGTSFTFSNHLELTPFDTISPAKPSFYSASVLNNRQLQLNWEYDGDSDIKYYTIEKFESGNWSFVDTVVRNSFFTDSVTNATDSIYTYRINAIDSCNNLHISPYSDSITNFIYTVGLDTCDATSYLTWTKPLGLLDNIDRYFISRSVDGRPFRIIDTVNAPNLSFADTNVLSKSKYAYRIIASNSTIQKTSQTDTIEFIQKVRPKPKAPKLLYTSVTQTGDVGGQVEIVWNKIDRSDDEFVTGYKVYSADTIVQQYSLIASLNSRNDTSLIHQTANSTKYNYYRIAATNTCGAIGDSSLLTATIQLEVENLNLSSNLTWSEYFGFDVDEYRIYSSVAGAPFTQVGTVAPTRFRFRDSTVGCGESIDFRVEAISDLGFAAASDVENVIGFDTTLPAPTTMRFVTVNGTDIEMDWNASSSNDAKFYTIEYKRFNDNIWDTLADQLTTLDYTANSLPVPVSNPWQFRVSVTDSCGNAQPEPSPEHHIIAIEAVKQGAATELRWMNYKGWQVDSFSILRDGSKIANVSVGKARFDSLFTYTDSSLSCDSTIYDYQIVGINNLLGLVSESNNDTTWGIDQSTPAKVILQSASVLLDNSGVRLNWTKSGIADINYYQLLRKTISDNEYSLVKRVDASSSNTVDTVSMHNFKEYCYKIAVEDKCRNQGLLSNEACPIVLNGGNLKRANSIKWEAYRLWTDSVDYYEVYRGTDSTNLFFLTQLDSRIRAFVDTNLNDSFMTNCYRVKAVEKQGLSNNIAWSTLFCVTQEPLIYVPTAFSPEMSIGTNDLFGPKGAFVPNNYTMKIYNRWGQKVYETTDGKPWNGRFIDNLFVPDGVYLYQIEMTTSNGETYERTGNVKVLR